MKVSAELADRLERLSGLPSPPRVAMRIIEAARDPDISMRSVADVIAGDPVLAAKLLRAANSAAYGRPGGCSTLRQALMVLGLDASLVVALSVSLVVNLRRDASRGLDLEHYWRRSLLAASTASALARVLGRSDRETLFLAALLQDIGILALDRCDPELYTAVAGLQTENHAALAVLEQTRVGVDHTAVGAWVMERWKLPEVITAAIAGSHDPALSDSPDPQITRCVAVSGHLADVWLCANWTDAFIEAAGLAAEFLDLTEGQLVSVLEGLRDIVPETEALFEKDLMGPQRGLAILDEARELLMERGLSGIGTLRQRAAANVAPVADDSTTVGPGETRATPTVVSL